MVPDLTTDTDPGLLDLFSRGPAPRNDVKVSQPTVLLQVKHPVSSCFQQSGGNTMHRPSDGTHLFLSESQPLLQRLTTRLATMLGSSASGAMKVAAVLTSAQQAETEKMAPSLFSYSNLVHAVSGAVGSVIAITVFYPLDTVRTRLQVDDHRRAKHTHEIIADIVREEGIEGLYLGWFPVVTALCCSNFVYFYSINTLKLKLIGGRKSSPLTDLSLAFVSVDVVWRMQRYLLPAGKLNLKNHGDLLIRHNCGLYRGWSALAVTMWLSYFVYFFVYHGLQSALSTFDLAPDPLTDLVVAYTAGVVNVLLTTPLWVANTRLKLQGAKLHTKAYDKDSSRRYEGIVDCLQKIIQTEGVLSLWNGTAPSLLLAANPAIQFMVYESLKRYFQHVLHTTELSGLLYFLIGAIAKAIATVTTYPLQVIQSRLRAGYAKAEKAQSLLQNILYLVRHQGVGALYKGMEAKLFQTVLTAALMFVAYEKIAVVIFRLMGLQAPSPKS